MSGLLRVEADSDEGARLDVDFLVLIPQYGVFRRQTALLPISHQNAFDDVVAGWM